MGIWEWRYSSVMNESRSFTHPVITVGRQEEFRLFTIRPILSTCSTLLLMWGRGELKLREQRKGRASERKGLPDELPGAGCVLILAVPKQRNTREICMNTVSQMQLTGAHKHLFWWMTRAVYSHFSMFYSTLHYCDVKMLGLNREYDDDDVDLCLSSRDGA